jgi:hypothetical protein
MDILFMFFILLFVIILFSLIFATYSIYKEMATSVFSSSVKDFPSQETVLPHGVAITSDGQPAGISAEEWFHRLGDMLVAHYGEDIRASVNRSLVRHGMSPLH